jgi:hypothetical protein
MLAVHRCAAAAFVVARGVNIIISWHPRSCWLACSVLMTSALPPWSWCWWDLPDARIWGATDASARGRITQSRSVPVYNLAIGGTLATPRDRQRAHRVVFGEPALTGIALYRRSPSSLWPHRPALCVDAKSHQFQSIALIDISANVWEHRCRAMAFADGAIESA